MKKDIFLKKLLKYCFPAFFLSVLLSQGIALAADDSDYGLKNTATAAGIGTGLTAAQFLGQVAGAALAIAGSLFLFLMVYGGILILTSAGKQEAVKKGKDVITWAIIGAVILGAAYAITTLVFQAVTGSTT
jgi:hypothetical protein